MERTAADGCESLVLGRGRLACLIQTPTDRRAFASKGAGVETPTADVSELHALRGRRYAVSHKPPTDGGSIVLQCASVSSAAAEGNKSTVFRWRCLAFVVASPAKRRTIVSERACMVIAIAYCYEPLSIRRRFRYGAPAHRRAVKPQGAGMSAASANRCEPLILRR